jgi:hypothetical protein
MNALTTTINAPMHMRMFRFLFIITLPTPGVVIASLRTYHERWEHRVRPSTLDTNFHCRGSSCIRPQLYFITHSQRNIFLSTKG